MKNLFYLCIFLTSFCYAQTFDFKNYTWDKIAFDKQTLTEEEKKEPELTLKDKKVYEIALEDDKATLYTLSHRIKIVNSEEAVERNNRIYTTKKAGQEYQKRMVRIIKPTGEIKTLNNNNIMTGHDAETEAEYEYFALDGLEAGSIIEYIFVTKAAPVLNGVSINMQEKYPKKEVSFDFYTPIWLGFAFKSYNGFPKIEKDTTFKNEKSYKFSARMDAIEALHDDIYINYEACLKSIAYKLISNYASGSYNLNSFRAFGEQIHEIAYMPLSKKEDKILDNYIMAANVRDFDNDKIKIRKIEDYIKKNILHDENLSNAPFKILDIDNTKTASELGLLILYANLYKKLGIDMEIVASIDRYKELFDKDFENFRHLDIFILYFPKHNTYLYPSNPLFRYPLIPYSNIATYGYFIKSVDLNGEFLARGKIKYIEENSMKDAIDSMYYYIDFEKDIQNPSYKYERHQTGYAAPWQPLFSYIKTEKEKDDIRKELLKDINEQIETNDIKSENEGVEYVALKPYILKANFQSDVFTTQAGNNVLFKVGELIGPQVEKYHDENKNCNIEMRYRETYLRHISFKIPAGYTLRNLDKLDKNTVFENENGEKIFGFITQTSVNNDVVTIHNIEFYDQIRIDADKYYDSFIKVVNSAADFNKIVLVFEKK